MQVSTRSLVSVALVGVVASSAAQAAHHEVTVGKGGELKFVPATIHAKEGDTVTYSFYARVSCPLLHAASAWLVSQANAPAEPLGGSIDLLGALSASRRRLLLGLRSEPVPRCCLADNIHHHGQGREPHLGLLQSAKWRPLPEGHASCHQPVSLSYLSCSPAWTHHS